MSLNSQGKTTAPSQSRADYLLAKLREMKKNSVEAKGASVERGRNLKFTLVVDNDTTQRGVHTDTVAFSPTLQTHNCGGSVGV